MKAIMIMLSLVFQRHLKESKSKDYLKALEHRIKNWQSGNLLDLFQESLTIEENLKSVDKAQNIDQISKKFAERMQKRNVNEA